MGYGELLTCTADARLADYSAVTEAEAEAFLRQRVEEIIRRVDAEVTVELHDEQMAALVSFVYNLGAGAFATSTLLQMIDDGAPVGEIAREWLSWDHIHVDGVAQASRGLSRRRLAELGLYLLRDQRPAMMVPTTRRLTDPMIVACRCGRDVAMRAIASQDGIARIGECTECDMQVHHARGATTGDVARSVGGYRAGTN